MPTLKDTFYKLKTSIVGTKTVDIDTKLNNAVDDITAFKANAGRNGYVELVRSLISRTTGGDLNLDNTGGLFGQGATSPATFGQGGRLMRYKTYESIIQNINYCFRALHVLTDNILSPDDITKASLEIKQKSYLGDEVPAESKVLAVKEAVKALNLEDNLDQIIKFTLLYGDFFCEIADAKTALTSKAYLAEHLDEAVQIGTKEVISYNKDKFNMRIVMDYSAYNESQDFDRQVSSTPELKPDKSGKIPIENINLVFHDPNRVVKLQSDLFPLCFGYLIFPKSVTHPHQMMHDQVVNILCAQILKSIEKRIPQIKDVADDDELKRIINAMLKETDETRSLNIRYVPPDRIQHFLLPSMKYAPYGESIFDSTQFTSKVLVALETALAIQRLSRSTEKRKIAIELGLPRDARKLIEKMKEEFRKRKVSLDSFGTVDTIPSMITTFEDIYIPQKDGKAFVDVDTFTGGNVDIRSKVDELKYLRDSTVASLGVPPSFLNIEENLSNKAALGEENILFARTIVGHQKSITAGLNDLIQKVFDIIDPEGALVVLDQVLITLPPPKSLQFEREAKYIGDLTNLIESLERIGVPKEYSKKKYLTNIDWEEVENYSIDETLEKKLGTEKKDDEGGMGGMGGIGGF